MNTQEPTSLELLQKVELLLEDGKMWDGSEYSYSLVYPHKYVPLLAQIKDYLKRNEGLE